MASSSVPAQESQEDVDHPPPKPQDDLPYGFNHIQIRYKLALTTFTRLRTICEHPTREKILRLACTADEFMSFPMKPAEESFFRQINNNMNIPYRGTMTPNTKWCNKVLLLVQVDLLTTGWPSKLTANTRKELYMERPKIYRVLDRVVRCIIDILGERGDGRGVSVGLDLLRSVKAGIWEGSNLELLQVEGIGPSSFDKLSKANIKTIRRLSTMQFYHIERILSRNPPFGQNLLRKVSSFPLLSMEIEILGNSDKDGSTGDENETDSNALVTKITLGYANEKMPIWRGTIPWATLVIEGDDGRLVWFWRGSLKRLEGEKEMVVRLKVGEDEVLTAMFACEEIVGTKLVTKF